MTFKLRAGLSEVVDYPRCPEVDWDTSIPPETPPNINTAVEMSDISVREASPSNLVLSSIVCGSFWLLKEKWLLVFQVEGKVLESASHTSSCTSAQENQSKLRSRDGYKVRKVMRACSVFWWKSKPAAPVKVKLGCIMMGLPSFLLLWLLFLGASLAQ